MPDDIEQRLAVMRGRIGTVTRQLEAMDAERKQLLTR
jgi:hypothetical protein